MGFAPLLTAALLAGGQSSRFGQDKAFAAWKGRPLYLHQLATLRALDPDQLILSGATHAVYPETESLGKVEIVRDEISNAGPLAGLHAVFKSANYAKVAVLAVDLPMMTSTFLRSLINQSLPGQGIVPTISDRAEPLAAVYPREMLNLIEIYLRKKKFSLQEWVRAGVNAGLVARLDATALLPLFRNVNTRTDYESLAQENEIN